MVLEIKWKCVIIRHLVFWRCMSLFFNLFTNNTGKVCYTELVRYYPLVLFSLVPKNNGKNGSVTHSVRYSQNHYWHNAKQ